MILREKYNQKVVPELVGRLNLKNRMQAPRLLKVVLNVGLSSKLKDTNILEAATKTLRKISGQQPILRQAKKSISSFKIRKGQIVGLSVTLRGKRMYDFTDKFVNVVLPRVRDFRGLSLKSFDGKGNYTVGFDEQAAFSEIKPEDTDKLHGLEIIFATSAKNNEEGKLLLELLGFPFKKN